MPKASLRDIRKRIASVRSTQQITKAMKMVATAKLRRAQESLLASRPYANKMFEIFHHLVTQTTAEAHPLLAIREPKKVEIVVFTSDRGLCGAYNMNLIQRAERFRQEDKGRTSNVDFSFIGRKGRDYFRKRKVSIRREIVNFYGKVDYALASQTAQGLVQAYSEAQVDAIYLLYSELRSPISQPVVLKRILPVTPSAEGPAPGGEYIYEPSEKEILDRILPIYVEIQVYQALLESVASEFAARMTAMENATQNADEMIQRLTMVYNKARQAGITKELIEIVSGAEALK